MNKAATLACLANQMGMEPQSAKVLVVGVGSTGLSVGQYLQGLGFQFALTDSRAKPPLLDEVMQRMPDTPIFTGGFDYDAFRVATHLVVSPGLSLHEAAIRKAAASGAKIIGDIDLFACSVTAPIVAITGSNGKSTVTTLVGEMAKAAGVKVAVGGNLGEPALCLLDQEADLYVLELSSFQLERTTALKAAAATVLNISADHLDRHGDLASYAYEKQKVFRGTGTMVVNLDDPLVAAMQEPDRKSLTFSVKGQADFHLGQQEGVEYLMCHGQPLLPLAFVPLEGRHNAANALAALALGHAVGLDSAAMCRALKKFKGLEHRMQRIAEIRGVAWVNDSKATNIGACVAALEGYQRKVVLIAGGDAKGADMSELTPSIVEKAKAVVIMGKDGPLIGQALAGSGVPVHLVGSMAQAVQKAASLAEPGDTVLLSPACASLDQYKNYQDRGNKFSKAVLGLTP